MDTMPLLASNKRILHDYSILEMYEAGMKLTGAEVKSVKLGTIQLSGSYISIDKNNEVWIIGCHIAPYKPASGHQKDYQATRPRKLLLHNKEIIQIMTKTRQTGLTILPLSVYTKGKLVKMEIGIVRGKKKYDKREVIKKRDIQRDIQRFMRKK